MYFLFQGPFLQVFTMTIAIDVMYPLLGYSAFFIHEDSGASSLKTHHCFRPDGLHSAAALARRHLGVISDLLTS